MGGYQTRLTYVDSKYIEGEISAGQIRQNRAGARDISGFLIDRGTADDDDGDSLLPGARRRHAERIAALTGVVFEEPTIEPEKAAVYAKIDEIMSTKVMANDWAAAELRNQAITEAKARDLYPDDRVNSNEVGIEPGWARLPEDQPKPSTGFAKVAKPSRVPLAAQAAGKRLVAIAHQIEQTKDDRQLVGRLLHEAKRILGHGKFVPWVERNLSMALRTALAIMNECSENALSARAS
jgi:hypothetical protein